MSAPYPWLEDAYRQLLGRLAGGRLPHALLLTGPVGIGKRALAESLALAALCTAPGVEGAPCGHCDSCRLYRADTHPDLTRVTIPEDKTQIVVDQIRELSETMGLSRSMGAHRVALLWPAEAMNPNAANSLLKTLEEPPERTLMILVSAEPSRLPATIRSRCQTLAVPLPPDEITRAWLAGQGVQAGQVDALLCLARGAPLVARDLAEEGALEQWHALLGDLSQLTRGKTGTVALAERWKAQDTERLIRWVQIALWESARIAFTGRAAAGREDLQPLAKTLDLGRIFQLQDRLTEWRRLARTTVNPQMLLEEVFAGLAPGRA
ncbi:DNA-directed DNA polymerase [Thioalkalivibrio sulfidiphilus HL-EbGr7]|uniref:DNA-directed DNA polymerase n=1 Tax=Thioalkalivibrio sulfidiphilus (strain HL-EbGR7) TaxID=396588 RepID=B8GSK5_THISH|nr:DNA polymerase III subunit delta' [Thioalkalivibrio sulfidiphilus]ACL72909.1 DNA-directed DNA polymerase [Thioalkalivibrio sulfidiphilus HL-EbGr7]